MVDVVAVFPPVWAPPTTLPVVLELPPLLVLVLVLVVAFWLPPVVPPVVVLLAAACGPACCAATVAWVACAAALADKADDACGVEDGVTSVVKGMGGCRTAVVDMAVAKPDISQQELTYRKLNREPANARQGRRKEESKMHRRRHGHAAACSKAELTRFAWTAQLWLCRSFFFGHLIGPRRIALALVCL